MKNFLLPLVATAAFSIPAAYAQKPGDSVTPEALGQLEWIKGEAPAAWEPGKLYVLECWATWCGPCLAAIPHVDALYDKYSEKGLRVIGVDVWEDGKDKVAEFVQKKGDGMSYPVAYTGKGGVFETQWLKPAGVKGIPHTFLVKDGKVLAGIHPMKLTDELVESLIKGGDEAQASLAALNAEQAKGEQENTARMAYSEASKKGDADGMAAAVEDLRKVNPKNIYIPLMENEILISRKDWNGLSAKLDSLPEGNMKMLVISSMTTEVTKKENVPQEFLSKLIGVCEATPELGKNPFLTVTFSRLCWQAGNKDKALANAKSALETLRSAPSPNMKQEPFEKFVAAVEGGSMPNPEEFMAWVVAASQAAKAEGTEKTPAAPSAGAAAGKAVPMLPITPRS